MNRLFYNFKITFKNKELIFWTFGFPIIMATLFYGAFSSLIHYDGMEPVKIAFVENEENQLSPIYNLIIHSLSVEEGATKTSDSKIFATSYIDDKDSAEDSLRKDEIDGMIYFENATDFPKLMVMTNSLNSTIIQNVMTEIEQSITAGHTFEPANLKSVGDQKTDYIMIEFYTLLAMACLYGGMIATKALDKNLANMTSSGRRIAVSAVSKAKIILGTLLTSYIVQLIGLAILFAYLTLVLRLDFGPHFPMVVFLTMVGALTGLALGTFISAIFKVNENAKDGILTGITMLGCFFGGMMGPSMKYLVDSTIPIVNKVNMPAIISDGFYALNAFGPDSGRFWFNIASLLVITGVLSTISIIVLRRQKYDSI